MERAFFCYELDFAERYQPVIYYGDLPARNSRGRKQVVEVTDEPRNDDGEISLTYLKSLYPLKEKDNVNN